MDRRAFLDPASLLDALDAPAPPADTPLVHLGWRAMATQWEILLPLGTPDATAAGRDAFELLDRIEARLTVYRDTSAVSKLNAAAAAGPIRIETDLFDLLAFCARTHAETHGAFDVAAGALVKAWGFFKGPRRVPTEDELATARQRSGMGHVHLDAERRTVRVDTPGVEFNLGAVGKGWALDRLVERLAGRWKIRAALLHGGRSSVYGRGCPPGDPRGWCVGVSHPADPERRLARVWLRDRALGTSAATYRYLEHEGRKLGHVLDPRTGWPAEGVASCSVAAPTAAEADALSTAFFILGVEAARDYCDRRPDVGMILLPDGSDVPVRLGNLPGGEG